MASDYAVVMAGGSGTRFWPLSRQLRPKQLLPLGPNGRSLLRATVDRVQKVVPKERVLVVTSEALEAATRAELPELPNENLLAEPVGRNTAPCIAWAAATIERRDPEAVIAVLPADHYVPDEDSFKSSLETSLAAARDNDEIVTIGIRPTRPETGYGYIEMGAELDPGVYRARRFVEKPNRQRAEQFVSAKQYLWNSGMFFFQAKVMRRAVQQHLPSLSEALDHFDQAAEKGSEDVELQRLYPDLPAISVDHGIMEKAESVSVVPASFEWSDLGSWTSAWELAEKDQDQNALGTFSLAKDAAGNFVHTDKEKLVALVGVRDLVVVDTEDALLIMPRIRAQEVRAVVDELKERHPEKI